MGADPTIRDENFDGTPLGWAKYAGSEEAVRILSAPSGDER